jgi:hypothetical protein
MRMVPRENEEINETWIADRDRFGFEGMYSADRVTEPMLRIDGALQAVDWEVALNAAAEGLQKVRAAHGGAAIGFLSLAVATVEEMYLLAQIARGSAAQHRSSPAPAGFSRRRRARAPSRIWDSRSPTSRNASRACWSSARICATKCRCLAHRCARRRSSAGAQGRLLESAPLRIHVPGRGLRTRRPTWWASSPRWCARRRRRLEKSGAGRRARGARRR